MFVVLTERKRSYFVVVLTDLEQQTVYCSIMVCWLSGDCVLEA